ncbi:cytochrome P450 [Pseudovirgaria hyperparasitica]|uniref:Cytochrome P450 n=1 Tax=Pseudovirgaria hyperparasitica TaxID=470096 RepID=A0A6A6WMJ0_9PEZI|nr:cytochrome P450 [Pseudovirgaria hyperparasitica]KAF2763239.1 cytochrome P450 [Pseudovirgaria hyperparasitica]
MALDFWKGLLLVTGLALLAGFFLITHQRCFLLGRCAQVPTVKSSLLGIRLYREWAQDPIAFLEASARIHGGILRVRTIFSTTYWLTNKSLVRMFFYMGEDVWSYGDSLRLYLHRVAASGYFSHFHIWANVALRGLTRTDAQKYHRTVAARETSLALRHWSQRSDIQLFSSVSYLIHRIIVATILGSDFYENDLDRIYHLMLVIVKEANDSLSSYWPNWLYSSVNGHEAKLRLDQIFQDRLEQRERRLNVKSGDMDYLSFTVQDPTTAHLRGHFTMHFIVLWISIHKNTTSMVSWTLLELLKSPRRLNTLRLDLQHSDPLRSPVLSAYLNETHRHYSSASCVRISQKRTSLSSHPGAPRNEIPSLPDIPAGARVAISPYLIHHDPATWLLPQIYYPERWLEDVDLPQRLNTNRVANYLPVGEFDRSGGEMCHRVSAAVIAEVVRRSDIRWGGVGALQDTTSLDWRGWGAPWLRGDVRVKFEAR